MKLVHCKECGDIIRLIPEATRICFCGKSSGQYEKDGLHAWYRGDNAIPIAIGNSSLRSAADNQPNIGAGLRFDALVVPIICETFYEI